jgi:exonuclease III
MVSLNVRGLRDLAKRQKVFKYLQQYKGIILLQETHTVVEDENAWHQAWGDNVYFSHGSSNSRGVAIIINQVENIVINNKENDSQGRLITLNINVNNNKLTIMNTYFPTADKKKEQLEFLNEINSIIDKNSAQLIWGGDINTHLNHPILIISFT